MDISKITTMLKNPITMIGLLIAVYFFFFKKDKKKKTSRSRRYRTRYSNYRQKRRMSRKMR